MNIQEISNDKKSIVENILDNGYDYFSKDIENDDDYSLIDDEIAELYYELILTEIRRILTDYEWDRIINSLAKKI